MSRHALACRVSRRRALVLAAVLLALLALAGRDARAGAGGATEQPVARLVPERPAATPSSSSTSSARFGGPGLYRLREGKRVADAVARAGGATAKADLAAINLAAPLADGIQVVVPTSGRRRGGAARRHRRTGAARARSVSALRRSSSSTRCRASVP